MIVASNPSILVQTVASSPSAMIRQQEEETNNTDSGYVKISNGKPQQLPSTYQPGQFDVICGRGKLAYNHPGNKNFRSLIQKYSTDFGMATTRMERTIVVTNVLDCVRAQGMGFIKKEKDGHYYQIGDRLSREKIGTLLRDAQGSRYSSSSQAKKRRRQTCNGTIQRNIQNIIFSNKQVVSALATVSNKVDSVSSASLTDDEVMAMFTKANCQILSAFQQDKSMVRRFNDAQSGSSSSSATSSFDGYDDDSSMSESSESSDDCSTSMMAME